MWFPLGLGPALYVVPEFLTFLMDVALLNWNVRGLCNPAKRRAVSTFVQQLRCNVVCLQETKTALVNRNFVAESIGNNFAENFIFKEAEGSRGGILLASSNVFQLSLNPGGVREFSVTGTITDSSNSSSWSITAVYGPQSDDDKIRFLHELRLIQPTVLDKWMILGDFNLICRTSEKNNPNVNLRMLGRFRNLIDGLELKDLPLPGRRFTWSNEREHSTLTRIDRILVSNEWEASFPQYNLSPASTAISNHCPLVLKKMDV